MFITESVRDTAEVMRYTAPLGKPVSTVATFMTVLTGRSDYGLRADTM